MFAGISSTYSYVAECYIITKNKAYGKGTKYLKIFYVFKEI